MSTLRSVLLFGVLLTTLAFAKSDVDENGIDSVYPVNWEEMIRSVPGESLKAALELNLKPKYREGVFEDGHEAIAAVYGDNPDLASKLVQLARYDAEVKDSLRKRQSDNSSSASGESTAGTTVPVTTIDASSSITSSTVETTSQSSSSQITTAPSSTATSTLITPTMSSEQTTLTSHVVSSISQASSTPTTASVESESQSAPGTTQTGVLVPVQITSTGSDGSVTTQTTNVIQNSAPTSVEIPVTSTDAQGSKVTSSALAPAVVVTSTDSRGSVAITTSPLSSVASELGSGVTHNSPSSGVTTTDSSGATVVLSSATTGGVYTVTNGRGSVVTLTYTPGGGIVSQLQVHTSTLPNGQPTTITSFAAVGATMTAAGESSSTSPASTSKPGLQSGAATPSSRYIAEAAILIGACGAAAVLL